MNAEIGILHENSLQMFVATAPASSVFQMIDKNYLFFAALAASLLRVSRSLIRAALPRNSRK